MRWESGWDAVRMRVLVVEDDPALASSLRRSMEFEGYDTVVSSDAESAIRELLGDRVDVAIIDIGLPGISGLELVRRIRREGNPVPVLLLTARRMVGDRVAGLDAGGDDYLTKPFELEELLARVRALQRRAARVDEQVLSLADLRLNRGTHEATRGRRRLELTRTEFELLEVLLENPHLVLSRDQLWRRVRGYDASAGSNSLDVFVSSLRRKIEADGEARVIQTVRGVGYVLRAADE